MHNFHLRYGYRFSCALFIGSCVGGVRFQDGDGPGLGHVYAGFDGMYAWDYWKRRAGSPSARTGAAVLPESIELSRCSVRLCYIICRSGVFSS